MLEVFSFIFLIMIFVQTIRLSQYSKDPNSFRPNEMSCAIEEIRMAVQEIKDKIVQAFPSESWTPQRGMLEKIRKEISELNSDVDPKRKLDDKLNGIWAEIEKVRFVVKRIADADNDDSISRSIYYAIKDKNRDRVLDLVKTHYRGADKYRGNCLFFESIVSFKDIRVVDHFLGHGASLSQKVHGENPIPMWIYKVAAGINDRAWFPPDVCSQEWRDLVEPVIARANLEAEDQFSETMLSLVARYGDFEGIKAFLARYNPPLDIFAKRQWNSFGTTVSRFPSVESVQLFWEYMRSKHSFVNGFHLNWLFHGILAASMLQDVELSIKLLKFFKHEIRVTEMNPDIRLILFDDPSDRMVDLCAFTEATLSLAKETNESLISEKLGLFLPSEAGRSIFLRIDKGKFNALGDPVKDWIKNNKLIFLKEIEAS